MYCHSREFFSTINDLHGLVNRLEPSWHCVYSEPLPAVYPCSLQYLFESFSGLAGSEKRRDGGYYRGTAAKNGKGANLMFLTKHKIDLREPLENYILWSFLKLSLHPDQSRWLRQIFIWLIQNSFSASLFILLEYSFNEFQIICPTLVAYETKFEVLYTEKTTILRYTNRNSMAKTVLEFTETLRWYQINEISKVLQIPVHSLKTMRSQVLLLKDMLNLLTENTENNYFLKDTQDS